MKPTIEQVEATLLSAVTAARARGLTVKPGTWGVQLDDSGAKPIWVLDDAMGDETDCLCPMACVILDKEEDRDEDEQIAEDQDRAAAEVLGCTAEQVNFFIIGFDAAEYDGCEEIEKDDYFKLGVKLRQQMIGGA